MIPDYWVIFVCVIFLGTLGIITYSHIIYMDEIEYLKNDVGKLKKRRIKNV